MSLSVAIGSLNSVKVNSVKKSFENCFPNLEKTFYPFKVSSEIASMPMSTSELVTGAKNRANNALIEFNKIQLNDSIKPDTIYSIGLEGGIYLEKSLNKWFLGGIVAVIQGTLGKISYGKTASIILPEKIVSEVVHAGKELGPVIDEITGISNTREKNGAFGLFSKNLITREIVFKQAVVLALAPFFNSSYYS